MSTARAFRGVIPAMAVPFLDDYKVDEDNLARFAVWLAGCRGVTAVMTNGHTGEVGSLLPDERAAVTRVVADAVKERVRVVSAVCAEGTFEAIEHARAAAHAGADTVDVAGSTSSFTCTPRARAPPTRPGSWYGWRRFPT